jgi:hypothetical protein
MTKKDENFIDPEEENKRAQELAKKQQEEGNQGNHKKGAKELGSQSIEVDQSAQTPRHTTQEPSHTKDSKDTKDNKQNG